MSANPYDWGTWNTVTIDGEKVPGPCEVRISPPDAPGRPTAEIEIMIGDKNAAEVDRFLRKMMALTKEVSVESAEFSYRRISRVVMTGVSPLRPGPIEGAKIVTLDCREALDTGPRGRPPVVPRAERIAILDAQSPNWRAPIAMPAPEHPAPWTWDALCNSLRDANDNLVLWVADAGNEAMQLGHELVIGAETPKVRALIAAAAEMEALLRSEDAGQSCDYGDTPAFCPMPFICWRHRRDALLARIDAAGNG